MAYSVVLRWSVRSVHRSRFCARRLRRTVSLGAHDRARATDDVRATAVAAGYAYAPALAGSAALRPAGIAAVADAQAEPPARDTRDWSLLQRASYLLGHLYRCHLCLASARAL